MRRVGLWLIPVFVIGLAVWGCSQGDQSGTNSARVISPTGQDGGMGGHHGDECPHCPADICTCPNHDGCGMGGHMGECDPDCPGNCDGGMGGGCDSSGHGHHGGGGKHHTEGHHHH